MGRERRVIDPDAIYHVVSTGSVKGPIVWDRRDYDSLLGEMSKAATRYGWEVFAWCVMTTHHHVVLRAPKNGLSAGFQLVNGCHSRRMSLRYGRVAHLFRNRPYIVAMASDAHLVSGIRYVVRNPIEAGICARASQWRSAAIGRPSASRNRRRGCRSKRSTSSSAAPRSSHGSSTADISGCQTQMGAASPG